MKRNKKIRLQRILAVCMAWLLIFNLVPVSVLQTFAVSESEDENNAEKRIIFEETQMTFILGESDTVAAQVAQKVNADDDGSVSYAASFQEDVEVTLEDVGLSMNDTTGELKVVDYGKLADTLEAQTEKKISVCITATKAEGTNGDEESPIVYEQDSASYTVTVQFGEMPEKTYKLEDPDGNALNAPNGNDSWYKTAVVVLSDNENYEIAKSVTDEFKEKVIFEDQGVAVRKIYLRNKETGALTEPLNVNVEKIDSEAPSQLEITYAEATKTEKILEKLLWFYSAEVKITLKGYDAQSGIDTFTWSMENQDGQSIKNGTVQASATEEAGIYTATFKVSAEEASQLRGSLSIYATDKAGLQSTTKKDNEKEIVVDKTQPVITFEVKTPDLEANVNEGQVVQLHIKSLFFEPEGISVTVKEQASATSKLTKYLREEAEWTKQTDTSGYSVYTVNLEKWLSEELGDGNYNLTIEYTDKAGNQALNCETGDFIVDYTKPDTTDMEITFDTPIVKKIISKLTFGFYNPTVTVTLKAKDDLSGIDHFTLYYDKQDGASDKNVLNQTWQDITAVKAVDSDMYTASVQLPKEISEQLQETDVQLRGFFSFTATDGFGNTSDKKTGENEVIVIDSIAPEMTMEYPEGIRSQTFEGKTSYYYNNDFTVTFVVEEANFFDEDFYVQMSDDGGEHFGTIALEWKKAKDDKYVSTYTIQAKSDHSNDGTYIFKLIYDVKSSEEIKSDEIKNSAFEAKTFLSNRIVIDTVQPKLSVSYVNKDIQMTLKDIDGNARDYLDSEQTANITIIEPNFNSADVKMTITAKDASGKSMDTSKLVQKSAWTTNGNEHLLTLTYSGEANYTFDVEYVDLAGNSIVNYAPDYFTVDKTAPTDLTVNYSTSVLDTILSGISFGFYQSKVTVTISATDSISGVHNFAYHYLKAAGASSVNVESIEQLIPETALTYSNGRATATAQFELPKAALEQKNQVNGALSFEAIDRSKNESKTFTDQKRIVVDNITPTASVQYSSPVQTSGGTAYYDGTIQATIVLNEANFYAEDVVVSINKDGSTYTVTPTWSSNGTDTHTGTFSLSGDGDYSVTINYKDKSNNTMATYTSEQLTIDTQISEPTITVNGEDANGKAFKEDVIPTVNFEDTNYESYEIKLVRTRYDAQNEDVTEAFIGSQVSITGQGGTGSFDTFTKTPEVDGIYTLTVSMTDKAGHSSESSVTFTVNRFGSVYMYEDYLKDLVKDGGSYIQKIDEDLVLTEYNADRLVKDSLNIAISKDGKPLENAKYTTTPEVNDQVAVGSSGWYQYRYTIDKENFVADGIYKISISSKDEAGNTPEIENYENQNILFRVDSTAPEITSISGLENHIINAQEVTVKYNVYDTIGLDSVKVYVNEKEVDNIHDFTDDMNNYEGSFVLKEEDSVQNIRLVVQDKAGNTTDTSNEIFKQECAYTFNAQVTVSTNPFVRTMAWLQQHIFIIAVIIVCMGAAIGGIVHVIRRRKNK